MFEGDPGALLETRHALMANWGLNPPQVRDEDLNWQLLCEALAERIAYLLKYRHEKLLTALYILDVAEAEYERAMAAPEMQQKAWRLAEAVLRRESQKILTRMHYAAKQGANPAPREALESDEDQPHRWTGKDTL